MNSDLKRLLMLLVAAGFDKYRVEDLIYSIRETNVKKILLEFDRLAKGAGSESVSESNYYSKKTNLEINTSSDVVEKVVELLVNESKIPVGKAFVSLEMALKSTFPGRNISPPKPKSGFSAWINTLSKEFSESELLHVASKIRNQAVHSGGENDWVLKE